MAKKVSQDEYDKLRGQYEEKYGYDKMNDEQKEQFDTAFDEIVVADDKKDDTDDTDEMDNEQEREQGDGGGRSLDDDDEDIR